MVPNSGKALLNSKTAIFKHFYRTITQNISQSVLLSVQRNQCINSSIRSASQHVQAKSKSRLFEYHFATSALYGYNHLPDRKLSSVPLESQVPRNDITNFKISNEAYNQIVKSVLEKPESSEAAMKSTSQAAKQIKLLNDEDILKFINAFNSAQQKSIYHRDLFFILDKECSERAKSWKLAKIWEVLGQFNNLFPKMKSRFNNHCINFGMNKITELNAQELLVFLRALKRNRNFPLNLDHELLEKRLSDVLKDYTPKELGTVCASFFESKQGIRDVQLINRLVEKLVENADQMDELTVGSMLKLFRKSSFNSANYSKPVLDLQSTLAPYVTKWGPMVLIQLASVGTNLLYFNHITIEMVAQKFVDCIQSARVKDLERLAMVIAISCHRTLTVVKFWDRVGLELAKSERKDEIHKYPHSFISLVHYASMSNIFPEKLVSMAFDPDIKQAALHKAENINYNSTKRELLTLSCSLDIEHPGYDGPKLSVEELQKYSKLYQCPVPHKNQRSLNNHDKFLLSLQESTRALYKNAELSHLQPHFITPDVWFTYEDCNSSRGTDLKNNPRRECVLVAGSRNMYSRFRQTPMGPLSMKIRQLEALGYLTIPIPWYEFLPLHPDRRVVYLDKKIQGMIRQ